MSYNYVNHTYLMPNIWSHWNGVKSSTRLGNFCVDPLALVTSFDILLYVVIHALPIKSA